MKNYLYILLFLLPLSLSIEDQSYLRSSSQSMSEVYPKEEPQELIKMRDLLGNHLNLNLPSVDLESDSRRLEALRQKIGQFKGRSDYNKVLQTPFPFEGQSEEKNNFAFSQVEEKEKLSTSPYSIRFQYASASSYFRICDNSSCSGETYPWEALYGGLWMSNYSNVKNNEEWFQAWFDRPKLLSGIVFHIAFAPREYKVEVSGDLEKWETIRDYASTHDGNWVFLAKNFWWWRMRYVQLVRIESFVEPKWVKGVKIYFRDPVYSVFGLYRIEAITQNYPLVLHSGADSDEHECIVSSSAQYSNKPGDRLYLMNCFDAISLFDGRELWMYNNEENLFYRHNLCFEVKHSDVSEHGVLHLNRCNGITEQRFYLASDKKLRPGVDTKKCVTAMADVTVENAMYNQRIWASSTIDDSEHKPERMVDGTSSYWASGLEVKKVTVEVVLDSSAVLSEIEVDWKYPALSFEIADMDDRGNWSTIYKSLNNRKKSTKVEVGARLIRRLKIIMLEHHPWLGKIRGKSIYGINSIKGKSAFKALKYKDCKFGDKQKTNNWEIETVEFWDLNPGSRISYAKGELGSKLLSLTQVVDQIAELAAFPIKKILETAKILREKLDISKRDLRNLGIKLTIYENYLKELEPESESSDLASMLGAGPDNPIKDCHLLKKIFPNKLSGFYWIKPDCSKTPMRAFCDLDNGFSYAFLGKFSTGEKIPVFSDFDLQLLCAKAGLEGVEIRSKYQLEVIMKYIEALELDMTKGEIVPLAFDYSCKGNGCKGHYQSFSSESSPVLTSDLKRFTDSGNILNFATVSRIKDAAGVGMNQNKILFFQMGNLPTKGIVCSTNDDGKNAPGFIPADCFTAPKGNPNFEGPIHTVFKVYCKPGCELVLAAPVYGNIVYNEESSICRAAIHTGVINSEKGGRVLVVLAEGKASYLSVESFGITSQLSLKRSERSFYLNKYQIRCPIENFPKRYQPSSFLEEDSSYFTSNISIGSNGAFAESKKEDEMDYDAMKKGFNDMPNIDFFRLKQDGKSSGSSSNTASGSSTNTGSTSSSSSSGDSTNTGSTGNNASGEDSQSQESSGGQDATGPEDAEDPTTSSFSASKTSDNKEAIQLIKNTFEKTNIDVKKAIRFMKETVFLIESFNSKLGSLMGTEIASDKLYWETHGLEPAARATSMIMTKMTQRATSKVRRFERRLQIERVEKLKLQIYEPYKEDYYFWLSDVYEVFDSPTAKNGPSKWQFSTRSLGGGHIKSISQTSDIKCYNEGGCLSTILIHKYKIWHDFTITFSFMTQDSGMIGVVFRYRDPFNFYAFEFGQNPGFMRCRQVKNGHSRILGYVEKNGGIMQGKWFTAFISVSQFSFEIKLGEEGSATPSEMEKILGVEEQMISSGKIGFLTNGNRAFYVDKLEMQAQKCRLETDPPQMYYLPVECSRYTENYFAVFNHRYTVNDPKAFANGPSRWKFALNIGERDKVIFQNSKLKSSHPDQIGTMAILNLSKFFRSGLFQCEFYAKGNGIVGFIFKYLNNDNYYTFEVGGGDKKFLQMKKKVDGRMKVVSKNGDLGFNVGVWYRVLIYSMGTTFKIKFHEAKEAEDDAFPLIDDEDIKEGKVGFSTFGVNTAFDNFKLTPLSDLEAGAGENPDDGPKKDTGVKAVQGNQKDVVYSNENSKTLNWDKCLSNPEPEDRSKDCEEKYGAISAGATEYCKQHYCQDCCERIIDWLHPVQRQLCVKQCSATTKPTEAKRDWRFCIDAPRPGNSLYKYCFELFEKSVVQQSYCKLDFCNLCCVSSQAIMNVLSSDTSLDSCHNSCLEKYSDHKDIIF